MSTTFDLADPSAIEVVHVDGGVPKPYTTDGTDVFLCSSVTIDTESQVVGTIHSSHTDPAVFTTGDQIVFPSASPPTITIA